MMKQKPCEKGLQGPGIMKNQYVFTLDVPKERQMMQCQLTSTSTQSPEQALFQI